jgi:hypothetical protein
MSEPEQKKPKIVKEISRGIVAVAKYDWKTKKILHIPNFTTILIHTNRNTFGGSLSPYHLKNEFGQILENVWQFMKRYKKVESIRTPLSKFQNIIIWEHPSELHIDETDSPTPEYWAWRRKGMDNTYAVRYPNGYNGRTKCIDSLLTEEWLNDREHVNPATPSKNVHHLSYGKDVRRLVYCGEYQRLAPKTSDFQRMKQMIESGQNILIMEVDGPSSDMLTQDKPYLVIDDTLTNTLLKDVRYPFGHGYTIAALLNNFKFI